MSGNTPVDTSYQDAQAITPSDSAPAFSPPLRGLFVGAAGTVTIVTAAGNTVTFGAVPAGSTIPVNAAKVLATGTTATSIVGLK